MLVYAAPEEISTPAFLNAAGKYDHEAYEAGCAEYIEKVRDYVTAVSDPHPLNGKTVSVPYADGHAEYMIGKIAGKVSLIHIPLGDAWQDARFERLATVAELKRMLASAERMRALFA
jgi:hypothetical protein